MPDFANEANWLSIYDQVSVAQGVAGSPLVYVPIAPITLPNSLDYAYLRVAANYQDAKARWRLGAWIEFYVDEPNPAVEVARILAPVNKAAIIPKPVFLTTYKVRAVIPYYFQEISLQIDGYIAN
ncbi:hypothetical protein HCU40_16740 [Pseudanabaena biceps]|nr:hypothetical protein [Pseudanabaena biceps]